ncbi:CNT family concentrative nucleoside transporter/nucleoside transport protein [Alkalibacillus filiformis]|uniref:CNT family concentrative nucleoside transporter/nucleoside transport protein n=1 Tax=Alkalibacillus filiformis TaxID=200990 RepID=A0ABU0DTL0_9BACI|nr:nucleoside transporter C-terminal domain-containing protein [Alkalibacillus filiformis]MDQ0351626.1 CNT family concentrative nucleoside transporter/nucleoside transport protein [Alkalibacillus filiformis]
MDIILGLLAIASVIGLAMLMSSNRGNIPFKGIGIMLVLQGLITWFMFNTEIGRIIIEAIATVFEKLIEFGREGVDFVVGGIAMTDPDNPHVFFFDVLLIIIFFATILSVLTYLKVLPLIIKYVGGALSKVTGLPKIESFNAVNSMFFGQSEALIAIKSQFHRITENRLYIVSASAMGSVSASIIGAYMTMIPPEYVLVAIPLNMFSALIVASIIAPPDVEDEDDEVDVKNVTESKSIFEAMANGAMDGGKIALIVATMLIAFLAALELVNFIVGAVIPGASLELALGYLLLPITFLMGISPGEMLDAGSLMGLKIVTNEFVAMLQFIEMQEQFSEKTIGIVSVFLTSFANFGSIGIVAGTVAGIDAEKGKTVSRFGMKLLVGATLASILSATIAGLFL